MSLPTVSAVLTAALLCGCAAPITPAPPVPEGASRAFAAARALEREGLLGDPESRRQARESARRALELDPSWVAPRRLLDDLDREELLGPAALGRHMVLLEQNPQDAASNYLAGRLMGTRGGPSFERAAAEMPWLGWAWHGQAWLAYQSGDLVRAERLGRRALRLARDPGEVALFGEVLARYLAARGEHEAAIEHLDLVREGLGPCPESDELEVRQALLELGAETREVRLRGERRALELVRSGRAVPAEWSALIAAAEPEPAGGRSALEVALLELRGQGEVVGPDLISRTITGPLARAAGEPRSTLEAYLQGSAADAVESWRSRLPSAVLDGSGMPRDPRLARIVNSSRSLAVGSPEASMEFASALLEAGWFAEAAAFAQTVPGGDVDAAMGVLARAEAGRLAMAQVGRLMREVDAGQGRGPVPLDPGAPWPRVRDLDDLLEALSSHLALALGTEDESGRQELHAELRRSPRIAYGPAGEIVHPGPVFSRQDEALARGSAGDPVGGLAASLDALGRFGIFGDSLGSPPDGVVLRRLWWEWREGEHLGVPFAGTIVWCEGADVEARAGRMGASIAGAALHEGYFVDIQPLRRSMARWMRIASSFADEAGPGRAAAALAVQPLACDDFERTSIRELLGAGDRLALAIMLELGQDGRPATPELDTFVRLTELHEEGHLCDRTRFYPVAERWPTLVAFLFANHLDPGLVARRLEERAQLMALATCDDPRIALVEILWAAEFGGDGTTPHAEAYTVLAGEFLEELSRRVLQEPGRWPALDSDARLGHQVHKLDPEEVREVALTLASERGLIGL